MTDIVFTKRAAIPMTTATINYVPTDATDSVADLLQGISDGNPAHRVQFPERLGGWLVATARRECLHILRQTKLGPHLTDVVPETASELSASPEQHAIDAHTTRTLQKLINELSPLRRTVIRVLFADNPCSYAKVVRNPGIPPSGIGSTRARTLRQLHNNLNEYEVGPGACQ